MPAIEKDSCVGKRNYFLSEDGLWRAIMETVTARYGEGNLYRYRSEWSGCVLCAPIRFIGYNLEIELESKLHSSVEASGR